MNGRTDATSISASDELDFLGGHVALNFINSSRVDAGVLSDIFQIDKDVIAWMRRMNIAPPTIQKPLARGALLKAARTLRSLALDALQRRKLGQRLTLGGLNRFLAESVSHIEVRQRKEAIETHRVYFAKSAEQFLAPVAEEISDLLAHGNFDLIRRCEGTDCVLWFVDHTKGHRRRWCSEKTCGTRARVAAFRARHAPE